MSKRVQKEKQKAEQRKEPEPSVTADRSKAEKLDSEMDAILEDIDSVLEENAQEFVQSYVQKGGE